MGTQVAQTLQRPQSQRVEKRKWLALGVLALALAIVIIDTTIVNVTIPSIRKEFNASLRDIEWISAVYALVYGALILTWGKLSDELGRRRIFIMGVATFVAGSLVVGAAPSIGMILVGRVVQGLGAAMTSPSTLSILSSMFTGKSRGVAFGIWGATAGAASALGPLLGGLLTTYANWRWAFLINIPIGVVAIAGSLLLIPESKGTDRRSKLDIPGIIFISAGLGAIIFGLIEGQTYGWLQPKDTFSIFGFDWPLVNIAVSPVMFAVGILFSLIFVLYELGVQRRGGDPLFDFTLLRFRGFRYGLVTILIVALGEFGVIFVLSLYLQVVRGLSAFDTGVLLLPLPIASFIAAPTAGLLSARFGPKWVVTTGMVFEAISIFLIGLVLGVDTPLIQFVPVFVLYGIGIGLSIAQLTNLTLSDIPREQAGAGSGANNTVRQVGAAIGIAVLGAILNTQIATTGKAELQANTSIPGVIKAPLLASFDKGISEGSTGSDQGGNGTSANSPLGSTIKGIFDDAITQGAKSAAYAAAFFVLLGVLSSLVIPNTGRHEARETSLEDAHDKREEEQAEQRAERVEAAS